MSETNGHTNGKHRHVPTRLPDPPSALVTAHTVYAAAALQGLLANTEIIHDLDKTSSLAARYADRMCDRDEERGRMG